jgi:hypothetical protein
MTGPRSSATIQRRTPGLSLDEAQWESAIEHRNVRWTLEGPQAADRRRPHISHVSLEGSHPPLRAALEHHFRLEGAPHDLIRREGIGPALISTKRRKLHGL